MGIISRERTMERHGEKQKINYVKKELKLILNIQMQNRHECELVNFHR
jgi:hypothetical protein